MLSCFSKILGNKPSEKLCKEPGGIAFLQKSEIIYSSELGMFRQGIVQAEVLSMKDASHPANTGTDWGKEGAVSGPWVRLLDWDRLLEILDAPGHGNTRSLAD